MAMVTIGILAHGDAGKTSLTKHILFATDAIASAVVSFRLNNRTVNLIETPGHRDAVAEVERSLLLIFVNKVNRLATCSEARRFACIPFGR